MKISPLKNEKELLESISIGEQGAFTVLFNHYSDLVFSFALRLTKSGNLAEEITQEIFLKIWVNREHLESIENFEPYLKRMTKNHALNILKRIDHEAIISNELSKQMTENITNTENEIYFHDTNRLLNQAIDNLTVQQKVVYNLCHQEGLKYEEVASQLNISSGTVHTHMKNALRLIRNHLTRMHSIIIYVLVLYRCL